MPNGDEGSYPEPTLVEKAQRATDKIEHLEKRVEVLERKLVTLSRENTRLREKVIDATLSNDTEQVEKENEQLKDVLETVRGGNPVMDCLTGKKPEKGEHVPWPFATGEDD